MSKNFRNNLLVWLSKVNSLTKKPKKTASNIVKRLTNFEQKGSREMIEEKIVGILYPRFEELKMQQKTIADGMKLIEEYLRQNQLNTNEKLHEMITQQVQRFFSNSLENPSDCQDYVFNIWDEQAGTYDCVCPKTTKDLRFSEQKQECYRCQRACHIHCLWSRQKKDELYECPMCFLKNCIPNKPVNKILFAGFLRQIKKDKIQYKINLPLENEIREDVIIEARCVRLCKDNKYEITWPMNCSVLLNNRKLMEFKPLNTNSSIKKRVDDQIVLDRRFLNKRNTIAIEEKHQYAEGLRPTVYENHMVFICEVQQSSVEEMTVQTMKERMSVEQSKQILREYLDRGMQDCIIEQLKIKLKCQFYNGKITIPTRSKHCTSHYQPFDLRGFLMANINLRSSAQRWKCPICRERAYHLVVDDYLLDFITARKDLTEIEFNNKGDYKMVEQEESDNESQKPIEQMVNPHCEVIECQMEEEVNQDQNAEVEGQKQKSYMQFIEIQSDDQQQLPEKPKRVLDGCGEIEEISSAVPQKRRKSTNVEPRSNPLSFLRMKKASNMKDESDLSESDQINFQSKYSPEHSLSDFKPERKEKRQRKHRKDRVFQEEARKDLDKMSKIPVYAPAISTVTPEINKVLEKRLPEITKRYPSQVPVIDIDSQSQNEQAEQMRKELKIKYHLNELEKQKNFLIQRTQKCEITPSDEALFLSLCEKFMTASIKGY